MVRKGCLLVLSVFPALVVPGPRHADAPPLPPGLTSVSVPFLECTGEAAYCARTFAGAVFVTRRGEIVYSLPASRGGVVLRESVVDGAPVRPRGRTPSKTRVGSVKGRDPAGWRVVPAFESVRVGEVRPGIELGLRARALNVEKVIRVRPGADPDSLRLRIEGATGLALASDGGLLVGTAKGALTFTPPVAYQESERGPEAVEVAYVARADTYGFRVGAYDRTRELVIDPLLGSTLIGQAGNDWLRDMAVTATEVYVVGSTQSTDFPTTVGAYDETYGVGGNDVFVSKLDKGLTTLQASTFLGGSDEETPYAVVVSADGVYVTGRTHSDDFPTTPGAYDTTLNPGSGIYDGFVSKLSRDLSTLSASTLFGGASSGEFPHAIALVTGSVYVAGHTASDDFPATAGAYDESHNGSNDAFVVKLSDDLTTLEAATYLGGSLGELDVGMAVSGGDVYVTGETASSDFPATGGAYDTALAGDRDAFVARLSGDLTTLVAATYLGGDDPGNRDEEAGTAIAVVSSDVYVAGYTDAPDFPLTPGAYDTSLTGDNYADVFVARLASDLATLKASTFLGGDDDDYAHAIALDSGAVLVTGETESTDFPTSPGAFRTTPVGSEDAFVSILSGDLTALSASTILGSTRSDVGNAITVESGDVYVAGWTYWGDFPTTPNAYDRTYAGPGATTEGFVTRLTGDLSAPERAISLSLYQHDFGDVEVGSASAALVVEIRNGGTGDLHVSGISVTDASYTLDLSGCGTATPTIGPGATCTVAVTFAPQSAGQKVARLDVTSDDPVSPTVSVDLVGAGTAPPVTAVQAFFLPKRVVVKRNEKKPERSRLAAAGFFDTGPDAVDLSGPATLTVGTVEVDVPALERLGNGALRYRDEGWSLLVKPARSGSSRAKFKLLLRGAAAGDLAGAESIELRFRSGAVDGAATVRLTKSAFKLGKVKGSLLAPDVFPYQCKAGLKGSGKDTLKLSLGLATEGGTPAEAPELTLALGTFTAAVASGDFERRGDVFLYRGAIGGLTKVLLDYRKEVLTVKGAGLDLGAFPDGAQAVEIGVGLGDSERKVQVRMVRKGRALRY